VISLLWGRGLDGRRSITSKARGHGVDQFRWGGVIDVGLDAAASLRCCETRQKESVFILAPPLFLTAQRSLVK